MENQNFENLGSKNIISDRKRDRKRSRLFKTIAILVIVLILLILIIFSLFVAIRYFSSGKTILTWASRGEQNLAGYKIYYGTSSRSASCPPGGYSNSIDVGNNPVHMFENLRVNSTYYFSVAAYYNASAVEDESVAGKGCFLPEITKKINPPDFLEFIKGQINAFWTK